MTRKEIMDLLLSKVAEDQKEAFIAELREAKTPKERIKVAKKYNAALTEEEVKTFKAECTNEITDDDLDKAAGGCSCSCSVCFCSCACS